MHEKYFNFLKQSLFSPQEIVNVFIRLIKYFDIDELKKIPEFDRLKNAVIPLDIPPEEIFKEVAIQVVRRQKLSTIKFLMDECGYDLTRTHDDKNSTLLHEACFFGSETLIGYLLQKGFSPNTRSDSFGETPLHSAMSRKNSEVLIRLLQQHGANLNAQTNDGLTALHMSVIHKNPTATAELIKLGADQTLKWNKFTHMTLKTAIDCGIYQVKPPKIAFQCGENIIEKTLADYYKGCLLPKFDKSIFQSVIKGFLAAAKLTFANILTFTQSMVLISSFTPFQSKLLQKNLFLLIKQNKVTHNDAVLSVLKGSHFFESEKRADIIKEFNSLALALMKPNKIPEGDLGDFYHAIGYRYKNIGFLEKGEHCLQLALEKSSLKSDTFKAEASFNLGCTQSYLMKNEEALKNFRNAFNLNRNDIISFQRYISSLLQCDQYEEALAVCREANFGRFSEIFGTFTSMLRGDFAWADLLEIVKEDCLDEGAQILSLDLRSESYLRGGNYDEALKAAQASFVLKEKEFKEACTYDIVQPIFKVLRILIQAKKYQAGLEQLKVWEESYSFELNCSVLYHGIAAVLYIANQQFEQADRSIQKINKLGVNANVLADVYFSLGMEILSMNPEDKGEAALYYINLALEVNRDHMQGQFYRLMVLILTKNKAAAEEILQAIEPEELLDMSLAKNVLKEESVLPESFAADISAIEIVSKSEKVNQEEKDSISEEHEKKLGVEDYDPVKIHEFFQAEKQRLLQESMTTLSQTLQPRAKWKIGVVSFEEGKDGLTAIKHHSYSPCYAVIHPHLALDTKLREEFQAALDKGTSARKSKDGVQTLNNAVVQLAIREEDRLYTTKIYRNANDHYLIVFDKHRNHAEVKQRARTRRPLQIIPLATAEQVLQPIIRSDSIFVPPLPQTTQPLNREISDIMNPF